jgi:hypothetical protein
MPATPAGQTDWAANLRASCTLSILHFEHPAEGLNLKATQGAVGVVSISPSVELRMTTLGEETLTFLRLPCLRRARRPAGCC